MLLCSILGAIGGLGWVDRQDVALGAEKEVEAVGELVVLIKEEVEIFTGLRQEKRIHAIFQSHRLDIRHSGKPAGDPRVLQILHHVLADLEVVVVPCCPVEQEGALGKLRTQGVAGVQPLHHALPLHVEVLR